MVKLIGLLAFGVVVGLISAGGSWYVQNKVLKPQTAAAQQEGGSPDTPGAMTPEDAAASQGRLTTGAADERLPVAVRPREMSVEELLRYSKGVEAREQQVRQQEELLQQRRVQQQLALADIAGERREVDGLRIQIAEQLKVAEQMVQKMQLSREELLRAQESADSDLRKIKSAQTEIAGDALANTKRLAQMIQSMEADKAAGVLKVMANDGELDDAVQILAFLGDREAAKILSALDDPKLVQQFVEKFQTLKRPVSEAARR